MTKIIKEGIDIYLCDNPGITRELMPILAWAAEHELGLIRRRTREAPLSQFRGIENVTIFYILAGVEGEEANREWTKCHGGW